MADHTYDGATLAAGETLHDLGTEQMTFQNCVRRIKNIYGKTSVAFDSMIKLDVIQNIIRTYFNFEEEDDVFEGFLHLLIYLDDFSTLLSQQYDVSLVKIALLTFHGFQQTAKPSSASKLVLPADKNLVPKALKIASRLKSKYVETIAEVFHLKSKEMLELVVDRIREMLANDDFQKAITWMAYLNIREKFGFNGIICNLILENQTSLLYPFIGDDMYRRKQFIHYLDQLLGDKLHNRPVSDELERRVVNDSKQLQKLTKRFVKQFNIPDSEVPNLMKLGTQAALLYNHYRWRHGEISWDQFQALTCHALGSGQLSEVRDHYFRRLCCEWDLSDKAYHFAVLLKVPEELYIPEMRYFCQNFPHKVKVIQETIRRNTAIREQNEQLEAENVCELHEGVEIILIDTWPMLKQLIEHLRQGGEELIGIDAEWRPHFTSTTEQISLLQVATTKGVFLVDVLILDEDEHLSEEQWLDFFDALLCTKGMRKIGFDFRNDMRVLRSTFPFLVRLLPAISNVVCMYRLLCQVKLVQEARQAVFDRPDVECPKNLSLSDVSAYFLNIKLEKSERVGNWSQRPLRMEQKKYAAEDAYCLNRIFRIVAQKLKTINDQLLVKSLQNCARIQFNSEEKAKPTVIQMVEGRIVRVKEGEEDFITNVQRGAAEIAQAAGEDLSGYRSIRDVRFIVDSMLFGLGKHLRKCGFDARMMSDRPEIVEFCTNEGNENFVVLSTGKGYKQLDQQLPGRAVSVPITTDGTAPPSLLVKHVLNELKIHLRPEDMWSRCVECNKRAFVRLPRRIAQALCYMNAVRHAADWLEISKDDLDDCFALLSADSVRVLDLSSVDEHDDDYKAQRAMLDDDDYFLFEDPDHEICDCRTCTVDLLNRLVLADERGSPVQVKVGLKFKKETFDVHGVQFYVCTECGKLQLNSASSD